MSEKRAAVIGTAESWKEAPWDDPGITICSLNDGYSLPGFPRSDEHYELHPFDKMWFRPKDKHTFRPDEIPEGFYVRPEGHLEWLREHAKTIPVWLRDAPPEGWPVNARRFPVEEIKPFLRARPDQDAFVASSPAMMVAHLVLRGFREIQIFGIHLATHSEYVKQLPNFSWLLGKIEALGVKVVLPPSCPLLKHTHVYAYEPEPQRPDAAAQKRLAKAQREFSTLTVRLAKLPRWKSKAAELERLIRVQAEMRDAQQEAHRAQLLAVGG